MTEGSRFEYELTEIDRCVDLLRDQLPPSELFYSVKANPHPLVVRRCVEHGLSLEVSSLGELDIALQAAADDTRILCTGPGKSDDYIQRSLATGSTISVESMDEVTKLSALGDYPGDVLLRVNASTQARNASLQMTGVPSQFGVDEEGCETVARALSEGPHTLRGVHLYMGSNVADEDDLVQQFTIGVGIAKKLEKYVEGDYVVDLGGGFGHPFAVPGGSPTWPTLKQRLLEQVELHEGTSWKLAFESGRYLVSACGTLVVEVLEVKWSKGIRYAIASSGINHLGGLSGLRRIPQIRVEAEQEDTDSDTGSDTDTDPESAGQMTRLAGPLCTPVDVLSPRLEVDSEVGDEIRIPNVGAYGLNASLANFLSHPYPVEIVLDNGEAVSATRQRTVRDEVVLP